MKKELELELVRKYPNLYVDYYASHRKSNMAFGFDGIGNGWYDIIDILSSKLETMILELPEEQRQNYRASQVKSKFASLRMYLTGGTPDMFAAIDEAEELSSKTCENCGKPGTIGGTGWVRCECDVCRMLK